MKVAISVDNHFDVNHVDGLAMIPRQAAYLRAQGVGVYVNAGDTYNDFAQTVTYFHALQAALGTDVTVRFLAGNHDLVRGITYAAAQSDVDPLYVHEKVVPLTPHAVLIGNNGWYDYSLAPPTLAKTPAEFAQWKRAYWVDRNIPQPVSDAARMARVLRTSEAALRANAGKRVLYVTHFVPRRDFMVYSPTHPQWQMATALMGSAKLGQLLERYGVQDVVFGHLHVRHPARTFGSTTYHHQPVGYGLKRLFEWQSHDWFTEWQNTLVMVTV